MKIPRKEGKGTFKSAWLFSGKQCGILMTSFLFHATVLENSILIMCFGIRLFIQKYYTAFSDFFSFLFFFFDRMSCFHQFFHTRRPQQLHTDLLGLLDLRLEIPTDLLKKKEGGKIKEIYSNPPRR